jgi:hypothetical protein
MQQAKYWAQIAQTLSSIATTFDPTYKDTSVSLTNNNLTANFAGTQAGVLGTVGYAAGQHYFEATFAQGNSSSNASVGIAPRNEDLSSQVGYDDGSGAIAVFQNSGNVYANGSKLGSSSGFSNNGAVVGVAVDSNRKLVWFRVNGGKWNGSTSADPATGVGGFAYAGTANMYPALCSDAVAEFTLNLAGPFQSPTPGGYKSWSADALEYVVPLATDSVPGIASFGGGLTIDAAGHVTADTFYALNTIAATNAVQIDLTNPVPVYRVILNGESATFNFTNLTLPAGAALRFTVYVEQGSGSNVISAWDPNISWASGSPPILAYAQGARNILEFESIDGRTFAGFYVGQLNPAGT